MREWKGQGRASNNFSGSACSVLTPISCRFLRECTRWPPREGARPHQIFDENAKANNPINTTQITTLHTNTTKQHSHITHNIQEKHNNNNLQQHHDATSLVSYSTLPWKRRSSSWQESWRRQANEKEASNGRRGRIERR